MYTMLIAQDDAVLDEIVEYLEQSQRYSNYVVALCVFHQESRPSMFIYADTFRCASCGKFGKTSWLLQHLKQKHGVLPFIPETKSSFHSPWRPWQKRYGSLSDIISKAHDYLCRNNKTTYIVGKRKINLDTIKQLHIGYLDDWITIPFFDRQNVVIGATCRYISGQGTKYVNPAGQDPNILYVPSWRLLDEQPEIIIVAGIFDTITLFQLGISSLSATTGQEVNAKAFMGISKRKVFCFDRGEERRASILAYSTGIMSKLFVPEWPEGCKDINQVFTELGADAVYELLKKEKP